MLIESAVYLLLAVPFYIPAAFLADAVVGDAVRTGICVASAFPLAWAAGAFFHRNR